MKTIISLLSLITLPLALNACSPNTPMVAASRPAEFFNKFVNPSEDFLVAESKLPEMKLLEVGEEYPMRFVLFEDGRFYYQIDKLGDGTGWWKMEGGGVELTAVRPIFDMHLYLSAAAETGDDTVIRFNDRHGFNSVTINYRDPKPVTDAIGIVPTRAPELRPFTSHPAGI